MAVWTVLALINWTRDFLESKGIEKGRLEAEHLLAHVLGWKRIDLYTKSDVVLDESQLAAFKALLIRRAAREPLAYILGNSEFMGLRFKVGPAVLCPRPETELIVEKVIDLRKGQTGEFIVLDVGTGSGCIAVSVAVKEASAQVWASDISPEALSIADENAKSNGVCERVRFLRGDMFNAFDGQALEGRADFVLSNPPYVAESEMPTVMPEVRDYEPKQAVSAGPDSFKFHRELLSGSGRFVRPGGWLIFEMGLGQSEQVKQLAQETGFFDNMSLINDYQGIPRVIASRRRCG